jgi:hypothetical protein
MLGLTNDQLAFLLKMGLSTILLVSIFVIPWLATKRHWLYTFSQNPL